MLHSSLLLRAAAALACLSFCPAAAAPAASQDEAPDDPAVSPDVAVVPVKFERRKTSKETKLAVEWLEAHQDAKGFWSSYEFMKDCPGNDECWGHGDPNHSVGVSGLAALAILRATPGTKRAPVPDSIRLWLTWIQKQQNKKNGRLCKAIGQSFHYDHAVATLALCTAVQRLQTQGLRDTAQAAVDYITEARNATGGWRYDMPPDGKSDSCVTTWMLRALLAAEAAGLEVDGENFVQGARYLKSMADLETGRVGYNIAGSPSARVPGMNLKEFPTDQTETLTSGALVVMQELMEAGHDDVDFADLPDRMVLLIDALQPDYSSDGKGNDAMYWYYGTIALCHTGRAHRGRRRAWKTQMKKVLTKHQRGTGHSTGSWEPLGPWAFAGGRIFTTSLGLLTLMETLQ